MRISVPSHAITSGALVELGTCPRHPLLAAKTGQRTFYTRTPAWVILIALASLLVGAIVALLIRKEVKGPVPECARCRTVRTRFRLGVLLVWGALAAALFPLAEVGNGVGFLVWFGLLLLVLGFSASGSTWRVRGTLSKDLLWVELRGVEVHFVQAVQARMAAAAVPVSQPYGATPLS